MTDAPQPDPLADIIADIRKRVDDPKVIYNLHDKIEKFPCLSSGIGSIDDALGGGLPEGRITELYGPEASGKTTVLLHFIAAAQKRGEVVYFIDAENALDLSYAQRIGVQPKRMIFSQPDYGEQALDVMQAIFQALIDYNQKHSKKMKALIVFDSVAALIPKQDFTKMDDGGFEDNLTLGSRARLLSSKLPMVCNLASRSGASVVFINQIRDKIGVTWGATWTTPGGRALKFFASLRINVVRVGHRKIGDKTVGIKSILRPDKSKLFPIFDKQAEFYIGPNGIDAIAALVEECIKKKVITKSGAWLKYGEHSFQGAANLEQSVREDPELEKTLREKLNELE